MKKVSVVFLMIVILLTILPTASVFAEAEPVTVVAAEGWTNATYDADTKELNSGDGYSFTMTTSGTDATLARWGSTGITATKVVIPYQITDHNGVTYTVKTLTKRMLLANDTLSATSNNLTITDLIITNGITTLTDESLRTHSASALLRVTLPSTLNYIGINCFANHDKLSSISIPQQVTTIGSGAFQSTGLTSISLPSSITSLGNNVFKFCTKMTDATFNFQLTTMGSEMFRGCNLLTSFTIPQSTTIIGNSALNNTKLAEVVIPTGVTSIGSSAISSSPYLTSVVCNATSTTILSQAFENNSVLNNITFNGHVSNIGSKAFQNAKALKSITFKSEKAPVLADNLVFYIQASGGVSEEFDIYYPAAGDDQANYGAGSDFQTKILNTKVDAVGKTLTPHFHAVSTTQLTQSTVTSITPIKDGYIVEYSISLGSGISSSKNLVAFYNGDDLVAVKSVASDTTSVEFLTSITITKAKLFVWENFSSLKPLCAFSERLIN